MEGDEGDEGPSSLVASSRVNGLALQSGRMCSVAMRTGRGVTLEQEVLFALREHRELFVSLTLGVVGYALGHALLALSAGSVAGALGKTPFDHPALPGISRLEPSIATASYVGLGAAIVKALSGSTLAAPRPTQEIG